MNPDDKHTSKEVTARQSFEDQISAYKKVFHVPPLQSNVTITYSGKSTHQGRDDYEPVSKSVLDELIRTYDYIVRCELEPSNSFSPLRITAQRLAWLRQQSTEKLETLTADSKAFQITGSYPGCARASNAERVAYRRSLAAITENFNAEIAQVLAEKIAATESKE
jgi:hypothetical protein